MCTDKEWWKNAMYELNKHTILQNIILYLF